MSADIHRPKVRVKPKIWGGAGGVQTPGIMITQTTGKIIAHYSTTEALELADHIVDQIERLEAGRETALPTTIPESE